MPARKGKGRKATKTEKAPDPSTVTVFDGKPDDLTAKQWLFCQEFLIDLNGAHAAIRAGYPEASAAQMAYENLHKPHVARAIDDLLAKRTGTSRTAIVVELARLGFSDIRKVVSWRPELVPASEEQILAVGAGGQGALVIASRVRVLDSDLIDADTGAAIKSVSQTTTGSIKVEMHDKGGALEKLARAFGMYQQEQASVNVALTPTIILTGRPDDSAGSAPAKPASQAMGRVRNPGH